MSPTNCASTSNRGGNNNLASFSTHNNNDSKKTGSTSIKCSALTQRIKSTANKLNSRKPGGGNLYSSNNISTTGTTNTTRSHSHANPYRNMNYHNTSNNFFNHSSFNHQNHNA